MNSKKLLHIFLITAASLILSVTSHALLIVDEVENDGSWTALSAGSGWSNGANDLFPVAGANYFFSQPGLNQNRGIFRSDWGENYQFGTTLTATFQIGMQDRAPDRLNLASIQAHFFVGDPNDSDSWIVDTRVQTGDTPALGEWETWTLTTSIFNGLETQGGTPVTEDDPIGFMFRIRGTSDSQAAFDDLTIVPEPGAYAALVGLGALTLVYLRRRRVR